MRHASSNAPLGPEGEQVQGTRPYNTRCVHDHFIRRLPRALTPAASLRGVRRGRRLPGLQVPRLDMVRLQPFLIPPASLCVDLTLGAVCGLQGGRRFVEGARLPSR